LFDLDGTLIEFKFPVRESRILMLDFLRKRGYRISNFNENIRTQALIEQALEEWRQTVMLQMTPFDDIINWS
jgi:FMN phosphatase YigB (HAD superfamily)